MSDRDAPGLLVASRMMLGLAQGIDERYEPFVLDEQGDPETFFERQGNRIVAALAVGEEPYDANRFDRLPNLRLIAVIGAGMGGIDLEEATRRDIAVVNAGELNAGDVADYAIALMFAYRRGVITHDRYVRDGKWIEARAPMTRSLSVEKVGILGLGSIGRQVAGRLAPFGCEVRWWGPHAKPDLAGQRMESPVVLADWATTLVVAVAGNDDTRGLVDADILAALGADGLLVNVSRGYVVDEETMIAMLRDGRLGAAALDVLDTEPNDGSRFAGMDNVILAPHVAGATVEALGAVVDSAVENLRRLLDDEPLMRRANPVRTQDARPKGE